MKITKNFFYQVIKIKALITGAGGFVGKHLSLHLQKNNVEVFTIGKNTLGSQKHYTLHSSNDFSIVNKAISDIKPDYIFHLAGSTNNQDLLEATQVNIHYASTLLNSLEIQNMATSTKVFFMGSAAEYGTPLMSNIGITENAQCQPSSYYGQTKLSQTQLALLWSKRNNGLVTILRPFIILGSGMPTHLAIGSFFKQLSTLKHSASITKSLHTGNLQTYRDFIDVQDVVNIIWKLTQNPDSANTIYNLCTHQAICINTLLEYLISLFKIDVKIEQSQDRLRTNDIPIFFGDNSKLISNIGPYSFIKWQDSLQKMVTMYESE